MTKDLRYIRKRKRAKHYNQIRAARDRPRTTADGYVDVEPMCTGHHIVLPKRGVIVNV